MISAVFDTNIYIQAHALSGESFVAKYPNLKIVDPYEFLVAVRATR